MTKDDIARKGGEEPPPLPPPASVATAARWLEDKIARGKMAVAGKAERTAGLFDSLCLSGLQISRAEARRFLATLRVPSHLADEEGNWQAGAIAAAMDDLGAAAIVAAEGVIKVSVDFGISFFASARINEEVEMEARVVEQQGKLTSVVVEIRKKESRRLVAVGRQWMTSIRPPGSNPSKL